MSIQDIVAIFQGANDPRTGVGQDAPVGSLFLESTSGKLYVKVGSGVFDWQPFTSGYGVNANNASTGLLTGGIISINTDPTKIDITAGVGIIVDSHTDPLNPTAQIVSWSNITGVSVTYLTTADRSSVGINTVGGVVQAVDRFTNAQFRDNIVLGALDHASRTSVAVARNNPNAAFDIGVRLHDLAAAIGPINISGNVFTANGANMLLNKSAGETYLVGLNFQTSKADPDTTLDPALIPVTFRYSYQDGAGGWITGAPVTAIDPNLWDDGSGTLQPVPNGRYSTQRVFFFGGANEVRIQYSQSTFSNIDAAHNNVIDPTFIPNPEYHDGIVRAYIIVRSSTTDLTNTADALIVAGSKFGAESGGVITSVTTLQQAYLNSITPEITTISALGAVSIKEGVGVGGNLFEGYDSASNLIFSVAVNGNVTSGLVNGRDVAADGSALDAHLVDYNNPHQTTLLNLGGVAITTPSLGEVLTFDGTNWINQLAPAGTDQYVKWSATDNTSNFLSAKIAAGPGISFTVNNPGGNESITIDTSIPLSSLQTEIDNIETSLGTSISSTGTWVGFSGTNYLNAASSTTNALTTLDGLIPAVITSRHNGVVTQTFNITPTTLLFNTNVRTDANYTYSAGVITVLTTGNYVVSFDASYVSTSGTVTTCQTSIYKNGAIVPGSVAHSNHASTTSGQQTTTCTLDVPCTVNDTIQVVGVRVLGGGSLVTQANGCRLNISKLR